jgi:hypothetical protein
VKLIVVGDLLGLTDFPDESSTSVSFNKKVTFPLVDAKMRLTAPGLELSTAGSEVAVNLQDVAVVPFPMSRPFGFEKLPN